jgi:octaheme c-type cytochrome (tetrathionate reductase family)
MKKIIFTFSFLVLGAYTLCAQENHSQYFEEPFKSPQEVTETCLMCHEGVDKDIMKTRHWNWKGNSFTNSNGKQVTVGKQNIINNFCVALPSNWPRCTSCHISYGWKNNSFDFTNGNNIDCLICHDQTGTYKKTPTGAGMPDPTVDLLKVAQSVGKTSRNNCSVCHFNGGGGTGVKHGDMDGSMIHPTAEVDVHMGGMDFTCTDCHVTVKHKISGASHGSMAEGKNHISCMDCHDEKVHNRELLNRHIKTVACETCHIPTYARQEATKSWWDWSTAGQDIESELDEYGLPTYDKKKGDFVWSKNVMPEYYWTNGQANYYAFGDKIDATQVLELNVLKGTIKDPKSKIAPFKVMRGKQIYDAGNNYMVIPKLYGKGGYWSTFDWNSAAKLGMQSVNLPYSGSFNFVETAMYWPINHMVAPASEALKCTSCHSSKENKRMNWQALGYEGDPVTVGSRFKK